MIWDDSVLKDSIWIFFLSSSINSEVVKKKKAAECIIARNRTRNAEEVGRSGGGFIQTGVGRPLMG